MTEGLPDRLHEIAGDMIVAGWPSSKVGLIFEAKSIIQREPACPVQPALNARSESPTGLQSPGPAQEVCLTHLVAALVQQTEALNRLAASNEGMTQAISGLIEEMGKGEEDQGGEPVGYLNARARS